MTVCPVCEHTQAATDACEQCGKAFVGPAPIALESAHVEGLDTGRWDEAVADTSAPMEALERTLDAPVGDVSVEPVAEVDRARADPVGEPVRLVEGQLACRYCKHVQAQGALCEQCGMRMPQLGAPKEARKTVEDTRRCKRCGEKLAGGPRCRGCGEPVFLET